MIDTFSATQRQWEIMETHYTVVTVMAGPGEVDVVLMSCCGPLQVK